MHLGAHQGVVVVVMSIRFIDGFDHYDTAHLNGKWTDHGFLGTSTSGPQAAAARTGGQGLRLGTANKGDYVSKTLSDIRSTLIVGCAVRFNQSIGVTQSNVNNQPALSNYGPLFWFMLGNNVQVLLSYDTSGSPR